MRRIYPSCLLFLVGFAAFSLMAKASPKLEFRPEKANEDQKFYQEVQPLVEFFIQGTLREDGSLWERLCEPKEGFLFRYLGSYNTALKCQEWGGLFQENKKRWWGRHDGSGEPIVGTFKKIWFEKLFQVAKNHEILGVNIFVHTGNAIDQRMDKAPFVDLTWSGPKEYGEMGWESVRLFFHQKNAKWFLLGFDIYHWTI